MRIVCSLILLASAAAAQTTRYADPSGLDVGDCSDPANACRTIVYTVGQSDDGDEIELSAGEFTEDGGVIFDRSVMIRGQGNDQTFVQEATNVDGVDARVLDVPTDVSVIIEHLTLRFGSGVDSIPPSDQIGGGLHRNRGTVVMTDVTMTKGNHRCQASWCGPGGAIRNYAGAVLSISNCQIDDNRSENGSGGAVYNAGEATLENCTITNNEDIWQNSGGGIYNAFGATLTFLDSSLIGNRAGDGGAGTAHGGGLFNDGTATIIGGEIRSNTSGYGIFEDRAGYGGGIYNDGILSIEGTLITENETMDGTDPANEGHGWGAGIYNDAGNLLTITHSSIVGNRTGSGDGANPDGCGHGGDGAGIYNAGSMTMTDSIVEENVTGDGGDCLEENTRGGHGGGLYTSGTAAIERSTIRNNETGIGYNLGANQGYGAGIHVSPSGSLDLAASTISGNDSGFGRGGGIYNAGSAHILNSTISANISRANPSWPDHASGISNDGDMDLVTSTITTNDGSVGDLPAFSSQGMARLKGNIIAANIGEDCSDSNLNPGTVIVSFGKNLIGRQNDDAAYGCGLAFPLGLPNANGDFVGSDAGPVDPLLGPLADNGGPTLTHALLEGSTAVDNGACEDLEGKLIETDQRGFLRPDPCDIGAFELDGVLTATAPEGIPAAFELSPAYPNPFNPRATIPFSLPEASHVTLTVYDVLGRRIALLADGRYEAGRHNVVLDGGRLASGLYLVRAVMEPEGGSATRAFTQRLTLLK